MPLPRGPLQKPPEPARAPSGGRGYVLNEKGSIPVTTAKRAWEFEYVTVTKDLASLAANTGETVSFSISSLAVGDLCFIIGAEVASANQFRADPVCTTAGQISVRRYNADATNANDPSSSAFHFLVIHRNIVS